MQMTNKYVRCNIYHIVIMKENINGKSQNTIQSAFVQRGTAARCPQLLHGYGFLPRNVLLQITNQGLVVQKPISANPGLNF